MWKKFNMMFRRRHEIINIFSQYMCKHVTFVLYFVSLNHIPVYHVGFSFIFVTS